MEHDKRFDDVVYMLEADSFSTLMVWQQNHKKVKWEEDSRGFWEKVGECGGKPVCVEVFFKTINGRRIAVYEGSSMVVDHEMIRNWMKEQCPPNTGHTNAMNFHHILNHIDKLNKE